jgi:chromosome segregation ATPase
MTMRHMTTSKYFLARIGLAFGIQRRNQRMSEAASETHLLRDAELHLGLALWDQCEPIEEISVEYWNIRKINAKIVEKERLVAECKARLDAAHRDREKLLLGDGSSDPEQQNHRAALIASLDALATRRDEIIRKARSLRRGYDGLKTKLEVLQHSGATEEDIHNCMQRLGEIREEFNQLKTDRAAIGAEIAAKDAELIELEAHISVAGKSRRGGASQAFQVIGVANQELASLNAEIGLLNKRKLELCSEIGRYLSRNITTNPGCAKVCKSHSGLVSIMAAIRRSIAYNHRIAGV